MDNTLFLKEKKENNIKIKKKLGILLKYKSLGLIKIKDSNIKNELIDGLSNLPAGFIIHSTGNKTVSIGKNIVISGNIDDSLISGFDFILCDNEICDLEFYLKKGITPLIIENNNLDFNLNEFNPLKNEGNTFFYSFCNKWSMFYAITRYLENYKFPQDNKNLINNVLGI